MDIYLNYIESVETTAEGDSDSGTYSFRGDTYTSRDFENVTLNCPVNCVICPFNVKITDKVYLTIAEYSTGDSFGHDENSSFEVIDVFSTESKAIAAVSAAQSYSNIVREDGTEFKVYAPWIGYFESLNGISVFEFTIQ